MIMVIGILVIVAGVICWIGQTFSFLSPSIAVKLRLCEPENEMDESLYIIETKAHGLTDMLLSWILPISALMMILGFEYWPVFSLIGGGIYLYFPGIIMLHRFFLKRRGKLIGRKSAERGTYIFSTVWILSAFAMIVLAVIELY